MRIVWLSVLLASTAIFATAGDNPFGVGLTDLLPIVKDKAPEFLNQLTGRDRNTFNNVMNENLDDLPKADKSLFRKFVDFGLNYLVSSGSITAPVGNVLKTVVPLVLDDSGNKASITERVSRLIKGLSPEQRESIQNISPAFKTVFKILGLNGAGQSSVSLPLIGFSTISMLLLYKLV